MWGILDWIVMTKNRPNRNYSAAAGMLLLACMLAALGVAPAAAQAPPAETVLYNFAALPNGASPAAGVVSDAAGNLYGTASAGGAFKSGLVYKLTPAGEETILYTFAGGVAGG